MSKLKLTKTELKTVAGLVVAIPSLVGYNLLTGTIRQLTVMMDNFTEEFMVCVKLSQLKFQNDKLGYKAKDM